MNDHHAALRSMEQRVTDLEAQLSDQTSRLEAALGTLDARFEPTAASARATADAIDSSAGSTSRRKLLRNGAIAVGAGVAGAAALASPAAAADGDPVVMGATNAASSRTDLRIAGAGGALGHNVFTAQDASFGGSSSPAAIGGYATGSRVGNGVYGYTSGNVATDTYSGYALVGACDARGTSSRAQLFMNPTGVVPTSDSISHRAGEIVVSGDGRLWFCTTTGTPGTWQEVTGDRALITAAQAMADAAADDVATMQSQLATVESDVAELQSQPSASGPTFLPTSQRAFDSRPGQLGNGGTKGLLGAGENRVVDLTVDTDLPAGARGAIIHLTLAGSASSGGFLSVYSAAVADLTPPEFSSLNWSGTGQFDANTTVTAVSPGGSIKIFALNPAHVAIDVIAYYA